MSSFIFTFFEVGTSLIVSKLIEGNYPNYRQVIPGETRERLTISRESLLETVRRVSLLSTEKSNSVKLVHLIYLIGTNLPTRKYKSN